MKTSKYYIALFQILFLFSVSSCTSFLDEKIFSQIAAENFLVTREGIEALTADAYARTANLNLNNSQWVIGVNELCTDMLMQSGGGNEAAILTVMNFTWDPYNQVFIDNWDPPYQAIRDANMLLENVGLVEGLTPQQLSEYTAEFKFIRAINYFRLYTLFGPVPLRVNTTGKLDLAKATDEEMRSFIESELLDAISFLPERGKEAAYGRGHKAAAQGFLCKFYLQTQQWEKTVAVAKQLIDSGQFSLFANYELLFRVANERNSEYIWVRPAVASTDRANANGWMNVAFPDAFASDPRTGLTFSNTWVNFPTQFRLLDVFSNSFEAGDKRKELILTEYVNTSGKTVSLLENNQTRSFKYWPDPNGLGASHGNDIPDIRYADILLSKAEALNELTGPNKESVDLINMVRSRANLKNLLVGDFPDKTSLRNHILKERGWEFYSEGHRRNDLIRMDKFISSATERGKTNAKPFHVLFPIPQVAVDSDPLLTQNEGY